MPLTETMNITLCVQDNKQRISRMSFHVEQSELHTIASELSNPMRYALAVGQAIQDLIQGSIQTITVSQSYIVGDEFGKPVPASASDVEEKGVFVFLAQGFRQSAVFTLPTFNEQFVEIGGRYIDRDDPTVQAFVNLIVEPANNGGWNIRAVNCNGIEFDDLFYAVEEFKPLPILKKKRRR